MNEVLSLNLVLYDPLVKFGQYILWSLCVFYLQVVFQCAAAKKEEPKEEEEEDEDMGFGLFD
jgi:cytochrome c-type biogenesis protein CcmH/NrfF